MTPFSLNSFLLTAFPIIVANKFLLLGTILCLSAGKKIQMIGQRLPN